MAQILQIRESLSRLWSQTEKPVVLIVIAVFIAIGIIGTALGGNSPEKVGDTDAKGGNGLTAPQKTEFAVGDVVSLKDIEVTFVSCTQSSGEGFTHQTAATCFYFANLPLKQIQQRYFHKLYNVL